MAGETLSTSIDELSSIAVAEALLAMQNMQDLRKILTRRDLEPGHISVRFPKYGLLTAAALTQGADIGNTELTTTGAVATPVVKAALSTVLTDLATHAAPQIIADFAKIAASAIQAKINADIFALCDGFATSIGTTDTDINATLLRTASKKLLQAGAPGPFYFLGTPEVFEDLLVDMASTTNGTNNLVSDRMKDAILSGTIDTSIRIYGCVPVCVTSSISEVGDVKCGVLSGSALGFAGKKGEEVLIEIVRRPRAVGWDAVASSTYDVVEVMDTFGVEIIADGIDA